MRSSEELGGFVNAEQAGSKRPIVCLSLPFRSLLEFYEGILQLGTCRFGLLAGLELCCRASHQWRLGREPFCNTVILLYYMLLLEAMFFLE